MVLNIYIIDSCPDIVFTTAVILKKFKLFSLLKSVHIFKIRIGGIIALLKYSYPAM